MSNIVCINCGNANLAQSQFCEKCGAPLPQQPAQQQTEQPKQRSPLKKLGIFGGIGCLGFVVLSIVLGSLGLLDDKNKNQADTKQEQTASTSKTDAPQPSDTNQPSAAAVPAPTQQNAQAQAQQRAKESADHLAEAKKALADGYKPTGNNRSWGRVKDARQQLEQIQSTDKEYAEAQKLLQEVAKREGEIEKWAKVVARQYYADELEKNYLSKGMDVDVSVSGPENTTIKLKYVLMSRPLVYQMTNDSGVTGKLREFGFKKIIFTDGYSNTWNYDL